MKETSKILDEACEDVAVVSASLTHMRPRRRRKVAVGLSLEAKREVLEQILPVYRDAVGTQKRVVLDDVVRLTGYHRTYASWLLNQPTAEHQPPVRPPQRDDGAEVEEVLVQVWNAVNRLCRKLLIPSLPMFLDVLERQEHLHLTEECRSRLLSMSTATTDRLLRPHRQRELRGLCITRAGTLLKSTIPLRTFEQWDEQVPGFVEADLVAHCGSSVEGTYSSRSLSRTHCDRLDRVFATARQECGCAACCPEIGSKLGEISTTFEAKLTTSARRVEIDHPGPEEIAPKAD